MIRTAAGVAGVVLAATLVGQPPPAETGPITLVTGVDLSHGKIRQALIDDWNQKHPDTPVKVVKLPSSADLQHAQMLAAEQAGDTTYDVLNLDLTWTAEFADNNAIVPLDNEMLGDGDFVAKALESARYRDRLWAVPFNTDVGLLYYRKDIVGSKGLPLPTKWETWSTPSSPCSRRCACSPRSSNGTRGSRSTSSRRRRRRTRT
ncbi:hypothetical protein GCM10029964_016990 [Kibdelosporangium lantanae]